MRSIGSKTIRLLTGFIVMISLGNITLRAQEKPLADRPLTLKQRTIVPIAAFMANGNQESLKAALTAGLEAGLTINEIKEVLLQLYAYAGFPRSLNAIAVLQQVLKQRETEGIRDVAGKAPDPQSFAEGKFAYGKNVQTTLTGTTATGAAQQFVPAIDTLLKEHLFADIFSRNNLDYQSREIATIAALASLGGAEAQLRGHLNVGRNVGLSRNQLQDLAATLTEQVGANEGASAGKLISVMYGSHAASNTTVAARADSNFPTVFPKGKVVSNSNFSGEVFVNMLLPRDSIFDTSVGVVTFPAGTRSNWHMHPSGQILLVTDGVGYYQEKGQPVHIMRKGDLVKCLPNVIHWHGASPDAAVSHVTIGPNMDKGAAIWFGKVTDQEYKLID